MGHIGTCYGSCSLSCSPYPATRLPGQQPDEPESIQLQREAFVGRGAVLPGHQRLQQPLDQLGRFTAGSATQYEQA